MRASTKIVLIGLVCLGPLSEAMAQHVQPGGLILTLLPYPVVTIVTPPPQLAQRAARAMGDACIGTAYGAGVLGDLVFIRRPQDIRIEDRSARALAAAYISQDPAVADRLLVDLQGGSEAEAAYLRILVGTHIRLKAGAARASEADLDKLEGLVPRISFSTSDLHFLRALNSFTNGQFDRAGDALQRALAIEPGYFNAHMLRLVVVLRQLAQISNNEKLCVAGLSRLVTSLREFTDLSPCPLQSVYIEALLNSDPTFVTDGPAFHLTSAYLSTLARNRRALTSALARLQTSLSGRTIDESCAGILSSEAKGLEDLAVKMIDETQ